MIVVAGNLFAETPGEMSSWTYRQEWDKLNNTQYTLARSPLPQRGLYDRLRLDVVCQDNKLLFKLDANSLLASKDRAFEFEYQIDKRAPVTITMRGYSDKRHGYTDENVEQIVKELLTGKTVFIRAYTMIRTVLTSLIPLEGAEQPINRVLADCGVVVQDEAGGANYSQDDFARDMQSLNPEQQRKVLDKIKAIIDELR